MTRTVRIDDLRAVPGHRPTVVDRIWNAWWRPNGAPVAAVEAALESVIAARSFPSFTLVASLEEAFVGTVTVLEEDIDARPQLSPCVAALWVDEALRGRGVGGALVTAACSRLAMSGFEQAFLAARTQLRGYYSRLGWTLLESGVGDDELDVFRRALP